MRKTGFLCVLAAAIALSGEALAGDICAALTARLAEIEQSDRDAWQREGLAGDPYAIERERSAVTRALAKNQCRGGLFSETRREKRKRLFAGLFGGFRPFRSGQGGAYRNDFSFGTYRTLCVRTCDGYYFPISFSATGGEFAQHEMACRALCPGTDVALYVHRNPGEESGAMVSLAGEPYTALPSAFRYRSQYDRSCACGAVTASAAIAIPGAGPPGDLAFPAPAVRAVEPVRLMPVPAARPAEDDPDTAANRAGRFVAGRATPEPPTEAVYREGPDGKIVRLVGPEPSYLGE